MRTIQKYDLPAGDATGNCNILMPAGAQILTLKMQRGTARIWAVVDPTAHLVWRQFRVVPTGHTVDGVDVSRYVGTAMSDNQSSVRHIFEV